MLRCPRARGEGGKTMRSMQFVARMCMALLLAGVANAADPGADLESAFEARQQSIQADLDNQTDRVLRQNREVAEAAAKVAACRGSLASAEARALSASERHRRLIECFNLQRAHEELIAVDPE